MLEIIAAGALGAVSHLKSKDFVRRRLRYTNVVERPGVGLFTGAATAIVTGVAVAALPFVGAGAGIAVGVGMGLGVGTGISKGARDAREGWHPDD
jgi:hypothetical protein